MSNYYEFVASPHDTFIKNMETTGAIILLVVLISTIYILLRNHMKKDFPYQGAAFDHSATSPINKNLLECVFYDEIAKSKFHHHSSFWRVICYLLLLFCYPKIVDITYLEN